MIRVKRVTHHDLEVPTRGTDQAAGLDLRASEKGVIYPTERKLIDTGFQVQLDFGSVGFIKPRSGLAVRHGIDVLAGVIDSDYRGEVKVLLINHGDRPFEYDKGTRIAQLVVLPVVMSPAIEMKELGMSQRAAGGFGSTGVA